MEVPSSILTSPTLLCYFNISFKVKILKNLSKAFALNEIWSSGLKIRVYVQILVLMQIIAVLHVPFQG